MSDDKCRTGFGNLRCNFEPRYDTSPPQAISGMPAPWAVEIIEAATIRTYACDVCTACGKQVVRPK